MLAAGPVGFPRLSYYEKTLNIGSYPPLATPERPPLRPKYKLHGERQSNHVTTDEARDLLGMVLAEFPELRRLDIGRLDVRHHILKLPFLSSPENRNVSRVDGRAAVSAASDPGRGPSLEAG